MLPATLRSVWLPIHVTLAILGYAMFVLAASVSLVYLVYESKLKSKRALGPANEGAPSLEKLDRINYRLLGWGFLMLSLAIVSGAIWADATWGHFWSWEPEESWSLVIWILYAGLLESRLDRRMARAARGGAHDRGVHGVGWFVRRREPAFSGQARREFRLKMDQDALSSSASTIAAPPVAVRERLAFAEDEIVAALGRLKQHAPRWPRPR